MQIESRRWTNLADSQKVKYNGFLFIMGSFLPGKKWITAPALNFIFNLKQILIHIHLKWRESWLLWLLSLQNWESRWVRKPHRSPAWRTMKTSTTVKLLAIGYLMRDEESLKIYNNYGDLSESCVKANDNSGTCSSEYL